MKNYEMTDEQAAEYKKMLLDAAQLKVAEPIVAIGGFRWGGAAGRMAASDLGFGGLVRAGLRMRSKRQAGGLPQRVLIAATDSTLHVFELKVAKVYSCGDEAKTWDRAEVRASTERKSNMTMLTIETPVDGETYTLSPISIRDDAVSLELMSLLTGAELSRPASA